MNVRADMRPVALSQSASLGAEAEAVDAAVGRAKVALLRLQKPDGHWVFELEADATIPAEYVLLRPLSRRDARSRAGAQDRRLSAPHPGRARRLAALSRAAPSTSAPRVKAYFALKMIGDDADAPHMMRAREAILHARRRGQGQCLHPHPAGALRRRPRGTTCRRCRSS